MGRARLDQGMWVTKARATHGDKYDYTQSVYTGYKCNIQIVCPTHGVFTQLENNHRNGCGCPKCGAETRGAARAHTWDSFVAAATDKHESVYTYPAQPFKNSRDKVRVVCPTHGEFTLAAYAHMAGHRCKRCAYESNGTRSQIGMSEFMRRAAAVHGDTYEYPAGISGLHTPIKITCRIHGEFLQTPHNHLAGANCPRCVGKVSKGEAEVLDFVRSLGHDAVSSDRTVLAPFEIDVYVPALRVGIEYNGVWFHRDDLVGSKTRDKWARSAQVGVTLVQIFEDEWRDKRPQIEARLRALLGGAPVTFARKCTVGAITPREASGFISTWHTQGAGPSATHAYGLSLNGELMAVATFGKGRFKNRGWELLRFCSVGRVVGAISRLMAAFLKDHPGESVVSYADLRWGYGDGYARAGFTLVAVTDPDYWWADSVGNRYSRYSMQTRPTGVSERDYATQKKLFRVSGVGHKKWMLQPSVDTQKS